VDKLAPGVRVEGTAPDGTIEAVHVISFGGVPVPGFAAGIQWHPENDWQTDIVSRRIFEDFAAAVHAYALAMAGRRDEARVILERLQWLCRERYAMNTFTPAAYVALGELDAALAELHAANGLRCPWFFQMLADPRLKPLRTRPDFEAMLGILAGMETEAAREPITE